MANRVLVMSRARAKKFSFQPHDFTSVIISITDIDKELNNLIVNTNNGIKSVLQVQFDDYDQGEPNCITEKDAEKIAEFVKRTADKVDTVIVHCEAGISRSAGVAAAISKYLFNDDTAIFNNRQYCPNMTCYRYVLNALFMSDED